MKALGVERPHEPAQASQLALRLAWDRGDAPGRLPVPRVLDWQKRLEYWPDGPAVAANANVEGGDSASGAVLRFLLLWSSAASLVWIGEEQIRR
jgi:hypothetical protein